MDLIKLYSSSPGFSQLSDVTPTRSEWNSTPGTADRLFASPQNSVPKSLSRTAIQTRSESIRLNLSTAFSETSDGLLAGQPRSSRQNASEGTSSFEMTLSAGGCAEKQTQKRIPKKTTTKQQKHEHRRSKHYELLTECKCRLNCSEHISSNQRRLFNETYWNSDFKSQKAIILKHTHQQPVKRRRSSTTETPLKLRMYTCTLKNELGENVRVCLPFFF